MQNLIQHIQKSKNFSTDETKEIEKITKLFPYFQTAQILLSKGLLDNNSILYNRQLKKAALYSIDRKRLFHLIVKQKEEDKESLINSINTKNLNELSIGEPLVFEEEEMHSFSEWLNLSKIRKINRTKDDKILENFIQNSTKSRKIDKNDFFTPLEMAKESLIENEDLVTPTLARVYVEQRHYEKAIKTYKKLILKYPEKNSLFAKQIELINKIKEK